MSGCHNSNCEEDGKENRTNFCIRCNEPFYRCGCIWNAIRDLKNKIESIEFYALKIEFISDNLDVAIERFVIPNIDNLNNRIDFLEKSITDKIKSLELHLNKLHDMVNMEDRITAADVLCRITKLESNFSGDNQSIGQNKIPHKCPACDGQGTRKLKGHVSEDHVIRFCIACDGEGIVWS